MTGLEILAALAVTGMFAKGGIDIATVLAQLGVKKKEIGLAAETAKAQLAATSKAAKEERAMTTQLIERLTKERGEERIASREAQALGFILGAGQQGMGQTQDLARIFSEMSDRTVGGPAPRPNSMVSLLR